MAYNKNCKNTQHASNYKNSTDCQNTTDCGNSVGMNDCQNTTSNYSTGKKKTNKKQSSYSDCKDCK